MKIFTGSSIAHLSQTQEVRNELVTYKKQSAEDTEIEVELVKEQ